MLSTGGRSWRSGKLPKESQRVTVWRLRPTVRAICRFAMPLRCKA